MKDAPQLTLSDLRRLHGTFTNYVIWLSGARKDRDPRHTTKKYRDVKALWEKVGQIIETHDLAGSDRNEPVDVEAPC